MSDFAFAKLFEVLVLLNCNKNEVLAVPIDSKKTALMVGRIARNKVSCTAEQKPVQMLDYLATPHQSFDLGFVRLPLQTKKHFKISKHLPLIGKKVFSLKAVSENRNVPLTQAGLIETCEHTKRGLTQLEALPLEERATHPDQDYGLRLWLRYCELKSKPQRFDVVGRWRHYEIVSGTVLWADEKNLISSLPLGVAGAPVIDEKGEVVALQTALTPFKEPQLPTLALSVAKTITLSTRTILREAKKNGLWDY